MKTLLKILIPIAFIIVGFSWIARFNSNPVYYDHTGQLTTNQVRIWSDTLTPATANGQSINIASAGFSTIKSITVTPQLNTATVGSMPIVIVKSFTTSAIVVNILTQNSSTVTILGISVLSGAPLQFAASTSGMVLHITVQGN